MKKATFFIALGFITVLLITCRTQQEPFLENGIKSLHEHQYEEAVLHFSNALKTTPRNVEALMGRGKAYYFMGNDSLQSDKKAYLDFQEVTVLTPKNAAAFAWAANAKRKLDEIDWAKKLIGKALAINPQCAIAYCIQSRIQMEEKDYDDALTAVNHAVQLDSTDAYIWFCKGLVHNEKEQFSEATQAFNRAIELDPLDAPSYRNIAFAQMEQKKYFDAIENYTRSIDLDPANSAYAYAQRGWIKSALKRYEEAIADYDKSIRLDSTDSWSYFVRGYAKGELERPEAAITDYDRAIELNPEDDDAFNNRGWEYQKLGNKEQAKHDYAAALNINPDNKLARQNLYNIRGVSAHDNTSYTYSNHSGHTIICGVCSGSGQQYFSVPPIERNQDPIRVPIRCTRCNGLGYIPDPRY